MSIFNIFNSSRNKKRFTQFFSENTFGSSESRSGEGSTLQQTAVIQKEIPILIEKFAIKEFIDAPCGDFNWMKNLNFSQINSYTGIDIVEKLVDSNNMQYRNDKVNFIIKDICNDVLPSGDLLMCRDCLVHLSYKNGIKAIQNFKRSGIKYLLITTFSNRSVNADLGTGIWRTLNMNIAPFNFPDPIYVIKENCTEGDGEFTDKCLSMYKLSDINL